MKQAFQKFVTC